jgi:lysophospholipase
MRTYDTLLQADDGVDLFVRRFEPARFWQDRSLLIVHGMSEHGHRYEHVARFAAEQGWAVIIPDLRGHGRSGGAHTHIDDFSEYVADLRRVVEAVRLPPESTVILGHSMGGLIAARFMQEFPGSAAALGLVSPLLGLELSLSPLTIALGRILSVVRPQSRFYKRIAPENTTRNPEVLARRAQDPLIHPSVTAAWYFAMRAGLRAAWEAADRLFCPVLVMQAGADLVVDPAAAEPWLAKVASSDKTLRVFPEHYHELLNETDWAHTLGDMLRWFDRYVVNVADEAVALQPARQGSLP